MTARGKFESDYFSVYYFKCCFYLFGKICNLGNISRNSASTYLNSRGSLQENEPRKIMVCWICSVTLLARSQETRRKWGKWWEKRRRLKIWIETNVLSHYLLFVQTVVLFFSDGATEVLLDLMMLKLKKPNCTEVLKIRWKSSSSSSSSSSSFLDSFVSLAHLGPDISVHPSWYICDV